MHFFNVRGCNGSGKTTVLRKLAERYAHEVRKLAVPRDPPKKAGEEGHQEKPIPVTFLPDVEGVSVAIIGDYSPAAATSTTAGLDRVKTQAAAKAVIELARQEPGVQVVIFEGVVVSTIFGPWQEWSKKVGGMAWLFLDTPLKTCLERIQVRNGGQPVKEDLVADKHKTIAEVRKKALLANQVVIDLRHEAALDDLIHCIANATHND